ncbi:hypothetical protein [Alteromonas antoniana]|uniref:hypothetical protein n=1 Tax=Alteromonas antoniana TaxID=2803813 RepID=UPI001C465EF6|nr:hypothetical protein [Alteromonas antoniana]
MRKDQIYVSKVDLIGVQDSVARIVFMPDRRKGWVYDCHGEVYTLSAHQKQFLKPNDFLMHDVSSLPEIKDIIKGNEIEVVEFNDRVSQAGFGFGFLCLKSEGERIDSNNVVSVLPVEKMVSAMKEYAATHNARVVGASNIHKSSLTEDTDNEFIAPKL